MFVVGQRWFSEAEPELGLGVVANIETRLVQIDFLSSKESRTYNAKHCPLRRYKIEIGETLITEDFSEYEVTAIHENEGVLFYASNEDVIPEMAITSQIDLKGPKDRIIAGNLDSNRFYDLRYDAFLQARSYQEFKHKGFLGPQVRLIPHQIFVANEVLKMDKPKVMLCDEVGLGKTIESCLVMHSLYQKELVKNILILVPDSLAYQWFVELYKKFNMVFKTISSEDDNSDDLDEDSSERLIISISSLQSNIEVQEIVKAKQWDMLIVDESHQLNYSGESVVVDLVKHVNKKSHSTIFLSATPEVLGEENLFSQLNTLDPVKYDNYDEFKLRNEKAKELSPIVSDLQKDNIQEEVLLKYFKKDELNSFKDNEEIIQALVDRHGTGRNYYRNSRSYLEKYSRLFNDRILHTYPLTSTKKMNDKVVFDEKLACIFNIIQEQEDKKILIICHSKVMVLKLHTKLKELTTTSMAFFHSGQSLMERDRQAAFFADPAGARILISTEIGSEGRNFEFSNQMILFDLPKVPDQLEQRIGRLDRIGQENNINIHIPYMAKTFEEILFRWYHDVFDAFESSPKGAGVFHQQHASELLKYLEAPYDDSKLTKFISTIKNEYAQYRDKILKDRDLLIEAHSYSDKAAKEIIHDIENFEQKNSPRAFLEKVFDRFGVDFEDLNDVSYFIKPSDNMLIPSFPALSHEGTSITYDRNYTLMRDDVDFMSWEHPILTGSLDLMMNSQLGNATLVTQDELPRDIYFEFILSLQCTDHFKHHSSLFLPYTPIRVLVGSSGIDVTKKFPKKFIDAICEADISDQHRDFIKQIPKETFSTLSKKATSLADERVLKYIDKAAKNCTVHFKHEKNRLEGLAMVSQEHKAALDRTDELRTDVLTSICNAKLSIESIRLILPE